MLGREVSLLLKGIQSAPVNVVVDQYNFLFSLPDYLPQKARGIEHLAAGKDICIQFGIPGFKSFNPGYQFRLGAVYAVDNIHEIQIVLLGNKDAGGVYSIAFEHVLFEYSISPLAESGTSF